MRRFRYIIQDINAPSQEDIWLKDGKLYYFSNEWKSIEDRVSLANTEGQEANITAPVIKLINTAEDKAQNITTCSEISTTEVISVDVEGTINGITYDAVGIYHNGTVSMLEGNKVTVFDVDFNDCTVTIDSKYDTSKLLPYVDLEIGDSDTVKQYNKEHLPTGSFFVAIDYGYGTGTWNSTSGGTAHTVTATGNTVYYNISADGSVTKLLESPDLYWEYTQMGGTKTPTQFAIALTDLIGK